MYKILSFIRLPNLLIIAMSMSFILYFVINPTLGVESSSGLSSFEFILLIVSTLLISVGGYLINDIYDINPDSINKPGKNIIGNTISVKNAYLFYWITTAIGILTGTLLSYLVNQINFGLIFLFSAGLLWFYSQKYQCQPLIGNIVISVLSAISFGIVWLFDFYALSNDAKVFVNVQSNFSLVNRIVYIYMGFAFLVSLLREVIKDIEDYKGDNRCGCVTFTVKYGISASRLLALVITYFSLFASIIIQYYLFVANFILPFIGFFLIDIFFIIILFRIHKVYDKTDYSSLAILIKILMVIGILTMILFKY